MSRRIFHSSVAFGALALVTVSTEAGAQARPGDVIARACAGERGNDIDPVRLGEALLIETGKIPAEFVADLLGDVTPALSPREAYRRALLGRLGEVARGESRAADPGFLIRNGISALQLFLAQTAASPTAFLRLSAVPAERTWLFHSATPAWTMRCRDVPEPTFVDQIEDGSAPRAFAIRAKPEELALTGRDARGAGAFSLGIERTRTDLDDGSVKTVTTLSVNGTVGVRLSGPAAPTASFAYARYALQRSRTNPRPTLALGASEGDGDTNSLETGLMIDTELLGNTSEFKLFTNVQLSTIFDFANNTSRGRLRSVIRPRFPDGNLGLCGLGSYQIFSNGAFRTRCGFQFEIEGSRVFDRGDSPLGNFDNFLAAGARASFEVHIPTSAGQTGGVLASVSYRHLLVLHGLFDNVRRLEAQLKHRFWTTAGPGIDVGISYVRGRNELSFEQENVLRLGIGIVL